MHRARAVACGEMFLLLCCRWLWWLWPNGKANTLSDDVLNYQCNSGWLVYNEQYENTDAKHNYTSLVIGTDGMQSNLFKSIV